MRTRFTEAQRADPDIAAAEGILRGCVHCGFCTATCPTYALLGDELDSPRGRIYLIKEMLETGETPSPKVVGHIDRCLSCLSCMTTCPSGVNYMHLVDLARKRIAETFRRPLADRLLRALLLAAMPSPARFGWAVRLARFGRPFAGLLPGPLGRMLRMVPSTGAGRPLPDGAVHPAEGGRRFRVALLAGCVQQVLDPAINAATIRLLTRLGCEVTLARGSGCCGAIAHHMGKEAPALDAARRNLAAWQAEIEGDGLDAVVSNTSGCGVMLKDYGHLFRADAALAQTASAIAARVCDVSELLQRIGLGEAEPAGAALRRLPLGLRAAARPEDPDGSGRAVAPRRVRGFAAGGGSSLLRLGRHLQHPPAGARRPAARPQDRPPRGTGRGRHRGGQYRLHGPARRGDGDAGGAHGRAARLGAWRAEAAWIEQQAGSSRLEPDRAGSNRCRRPPRQYRRERGWYDLYSGGIVMRRRDSGLYRW